MQLRASRTKSKTPKKYSRPSTREHREYKVRMTFLVSVSVKLKIQTRPRRHWSEKEKKRKEKENLPVNPNIIQKAKIQKHIHEN